jgi:tyrosinase
MEVRDMTPRQLHDFVDAIHHIQKNVNSSRFPGYSKWDEWAKLHGMNFDQIHDKAHFFPWHRQFLWEVETEMRKHKPHIVMPYWDWTFDAAKPGDSIVMKSTWFGPATRGCVQTGKFANFKVQYPSAGCLQRQFSRSRTWTSREELRGLISMSKNYNELVQSVRIFPHGTPHVTIGGHMGQGSSPNDPLFFLHHAFVDKMWYDWQQQGNTDYPYDKNAKLPHLSGKVSDTLEPWSGKYCIRYKEPEAILGRNKPRKPSEGEPTFGNTGTTFATFEFQTPEAPNQDMQPLPDSFLQMHNITRKEADLELKRINAIRHQLRLKNNTTTLNVPNA